MVLPLKTYLELCGTQASWKAVHIKFCENVLSRILISLIFLNEIHTAQADLELTM